MTLKEVRRFSRLSSFAANVLQKNQPCHQAGILTRSFGVSQRDAGMLIPLRGLPSKRCPRPLTSISRSHPRTRGSPIHPRIAQVRLKVPSMSPEVSPPPSPRCPQADGQEVPRSHLELSQGMSAANTHTCRLLTFLQRERPSSAWLPRYSETGGRGRRRSLQLDKCGGSGNRGLDLA